MGQNFFKVIYKRSERAWFSQLESLSHHFPIILKIILYTRIINSLIVWSRAYGWRFVLVMPRGGLSPRDNDDGNYVTDVTEECIRGTERNDFHFHKFATRWKFLFHIERSQVGDEIYRAIYAIPVVSFQFFLAYLLTRKISGILKV